MHEIKLPRLGQSVEDAQIVSWLKQEGDAVKEGDALFTVQTDKAEIECESTASGVLRKILVSAGAEVPVLSVVALVGEAGEALPELAAPAPKAAATTPAVAPAEHAATAPTAANPTPSTRAGKAAVSPRARKQAAEQHINAEALSGSGVGGRVMSNDVAAYAAQLDSTKMSPVARRIAAAQGIDPGAIAGSGAGGKIMKDDLGTAKAAPVGGAPAPVGGVTRVPLSPMRTVIARRMAESMYTAPHYYVTVEVDMAAAKSFRAGLKAFKASFNDLVLYSTMLALREYPQVNARWAGDAIEQVGDINLGMAVALPSGLIVPVVKQAQLLSLEGLCERTRQLAEKAQKGKLTPDDYTGNTFTISNLGAFGVDQFTAIINQPDSAIIAVGQIKDRVVAIDGGIHIRPNMKLTISSDHRVIDGAVAAQFMGRLKQILETAAF